MKQKRKVEQARKMERVVKRDREEKLAEKMSNLAVGQEDLKLTSDVEFQVEERLIQLIGHLFKYDAVSSKNIPVKQGLFLCVDKVRTEEERMQYMIHVVD